MSNLQYNRIGKSIEPSAEFREGRSKLSVLKKHKKIMERVSRIWTAQARDPNYNNPLVAGYSGVKITLATLKDAKGSHEHLLFIDDSKLLDHKWRRSFHLDGKYHDVEYAWSASRPSFLEKLKHKAVDFLCVSLSTTLGASLGAAIVVVGTVACMAGGVSVNALSALADAQRIAVNAAIVPAAQVGAVAGAAVALAAFAWSSYSLKYRDAFIRYLPNRVVEQLDRL